MQLNNFKNIKIDKIRKNIILYGVDKYVGRMSADEQRKIFGAYLFGKKIIHINIKNQGTVSSAFNESNRFEISFEKIADIVNMGLNLHPKLRWSLHGKKM